MARTIGIDLGTTNSVVAFLDGDRVETIPNADGSKLTPSVVYYKDGEEVIVGELAKRQLVIEPNRVIRSIKRVMGKRQADLGEEQEDLPYKLAELSDGMAGVLVDDNADAEIILRPEEVSADILERLRLTAEDFLDETVAQAVITVPAHFNDQQRTATKAAAEMAGLEVLRIINEPTAAALAYGVGHDRDGRVAVFDFGGGTFDISILEIVGDTYEVLSTNGDNNLGGDDVDHLLFSELCDGVLQETGIDPTMDRKAVQRLREAAEKAKCELSNLASTQISLPFIVADSSGPKHYQTEITRQRFNEMMEPLFNRLFEPCARALEDANTGVNQIDEVILVGGSTRIPRVQQMVAEYFGREPNRSVNPDEAVAVGAAIQGAVITGDLREVLLLDITPLTLGIELAGGIFKELIPRNSTIPCEASRKFTTVVDNQTSVLVHVLQGERRIAAENHSLAKFRLVGLPPAPKELLEIEVRFSIDANGILSVSAMDLSTGVRTDVVVENYGNIGVRDEEVKKAVEDAEKNLEADDKFVRFAERRARAERLQDRANKIIEALGDLITEDHLRTIKESCLRLDLAMERNDERAMEVEEDTIKEHLDLYEQNKELARLLARHLSSTDIESVFDSDLDSNFDIEERLIRDGDDGGASISEPDEPEEVAEPAPETAKKSAFKMPFAPPPGARNDNAFAVPEFDPAADDEDESFDPRNAPPPPPPA